MKSMFKKLLLTFMCLMFMMPSQPLTALGYDDEIYENPVVINYEITSGTPEKGKTFNLKVNIMDVRLNTDVFPMTPLTVTNSYAAMHQGNFNASTSLGTVTSFTTKTTDNFIYYSIEFKNLVFQGGDDKTFTFDYSFEFDDPNTATTDPVLRSVSNLTINIKEAFTKEAVVSKSAKLVVASSSFGGSLKGGSDFTVNFKIKNVSKDGGAKKVSVSITSNNPKITVISSVNTKYIGSIGKNSVSGGQSFKMSAAKDIEPGPVTFTLHITYENEDGTGGSESIDLSTKIKQVDKVQINRAEMYEAYMGRETEVDYSVINNGLTTLNNAEAQLLDENGDILATAYIGNILPATEYANADLLVTFDETGPKTVTFALVYETDEGNKKMVKKDIEIEVIEYIPPSYDPYPPIEEPTNGGINWFLVLIGAGVVGAGGYFGFKAYKKKKANAESVDEDEDF